MKTTLLVIAIVLGGNFVAFSQTADPLSEGNKLFEARNYRAAADVYSRIVNTNPDTPTKAKAWFNLGVTYQKLGRYDDAINAFNQIFSMNVDDREPGGHIMELHRNYRSRAQWLIGRILFAKGDYKGALEAYQAARLKYRPKLVCNVELQSAEYRHALHEGLTYEHLGLYTEAVQSYFRTYLPRLVDLYEAAGQLDDLKQILAKRDQEYMNSVSEYAREKLSPERLQWHRPTRKVHEVLEIHALGHTRDWPALINLLRKWSLGGGDGREEVVVRLLARYPEETMPLLKQELGTTWVRRELIYKAFGFAGTPDAVATLKSIAEKEHGMSQALSLIHALSLAGESGEKAITELDQIARDNLRRAIDQYKSGELRESYEPVRFPKITAKLSLPKE